MIEVIEALEERRLLSTTASWAFDEAGGSTAGDASGNAHALTLTGGASFTAGHAGNALTLNGTNGYAQSPSVIDTQGSFTASAWVKFDSVSGWRTIMNQSGTGQSKFWLQKRDSTGKFSFVLATDDAAGSPQVRVDSKLTPVAGTWYHVAGVCNAAESTISLYVNGSLEGTEKYDAVWAANGPTLIGAAYTPSGTTHRTDFFPGQIDDARTDDVALSADQIATIAGRRGVWTMNEAPSTTTAADTSGAGNNLTLYSNAAFAPGRTGNALTLNVPYSHARPGGSVIDTTRSFTIDAWVKLNGTGTGGTGPTPLSGWQTVVSQAGTNRNKFWLQKRGDSGKFSLLFAESDVAQTNVIHVDSAVVPQANQWYHVAGMYDAAAESIKLYVDGVLQGTLPYTATWAATGDTRVGSGVVPGSPLTGNDFFKGQIDDLNVTNNTLTANQIRVRAGLAPLAAPAPTGVKVVARGGTGAKVTWTSAAEDATGYVVETSTDNGSTWTQSATAGATQRTAAIKDLPVSTAVKTRVRATNAAGNSAPSATATATTGAVDESGIYVIDEVGYGFLLSHGIADFTASGSLRFKDPLVHATQATDWRAAAEALLVGDAYVNGTHYAFPGDRFTVATGAQIGLGSGEGSLFQNHLTTATQQAIGFEDGVDGDFNDDFWKITVSKASVNLDLNADGDTTDSVDGLGNYRPGYLVDGTQLLSDTVDQLFNIVVSGLAPGMVVAITADDVTAYKGRASNLGSGEDADITLASPPLIVADSQGQAIMNAKNKDFAGTAKIKVKLGPLTIAEFDLSEDTDKDGLPNWWENQYGGNLTAISDDDKNKSGGNGAGLGDKLPALDEFRGFMVTENGHEKHIRTDPTVKDGFAQDKLGYTPLDEGPEMLVWIDKLDLNIHRIVEGQTDANRSINFNGANTQKAVVVENDGHTDGNAGYTRGSETPSTNEFCRVWGDYFTYSLKIERNVPVNATTITYDGRSEGFLRTGWVDGGRVRIDDEIVQYDKVITPNTNAKDVKIASVAMDAAAANLIINGVAGAFAVIRVGDELIDARNGSTVLGSTGTVQAVAVGDQQVKLAGGVVATPEDNALVAKLGNGADLEWISYTGTAEDADGTVRLTGVTRGLFGTQAKAHVANGDLVVPSQIAGCARGAFGTQVAAIPIGTNVIPVGVLTNCVRAVAGTVAAVHAANGSLHVFSDDNAYRMTAAHEFAHAFGVGPNNTHTDNTIMEETVGRGAYLSNNVFDTYPDSAVDQLNAR